jgi:hypothetical protein
MFSWTRLPSLVVLSPTLTLSPTLQKHYLVPYSTTPPRFLQHTKPSHFYGILSENIIMGANLTPAEITAYEADVTAFLHSRTTTRLAYLQGREFHQDLDDDLVATTFPGDIARRLDVARRLEEQLRQAGASVKSAKHYQDFRINMAQLSILLTLDSEAIDIVETFISDRHASAAPLIESVETFMKTCEYPVHQAFFWDLVLMFRAKSWASELRRT